LRKHRAVALVVIRTILDVAVIDARLIIVGGSLVVVYASLVVIHAVLEVVVIDAILRTDHIVLSTLRTIRAAERIQNIVPGAC